MQALVEGREGAAMGRSVNTGQEEEGRLFEGPRREPLEVRLSWF